MVSIHTPIQGVTFPATSGWSIQVVSIHTPIQGVTGQAVGKHCAG